MSPINDNGKPPWLNQPVGANTVNSAAIVDGTIATADIGDGEVTRPDLSDDQKLPVSPTGPQATGSLPYWDDALGEWASNPDGVKLRSAVLNRIFIPGVNGEINFGSGTIEGSTDARISRAGDRHLDFVSTSITVSGGSAPLFGVYTGSLKAAGGDVGLVSSHLMQAESGDTEPRTMLYRTAGIWFGSGAAAVDTNLSRSGIAKLTANGGIGFHGVTPPAQAAAITAPTAPGVVYSQAEAQSMEAAVNAIRVALAGIGITA